jgi:sec-independent protein translocase protein TatC
MNQPENGRMPLTSHLEELRTRLIRILIVVGVGFGVCYAFKDALFRVITRPLTSVLPPSSFMIYTSLPEAFFIYMKIAFFASLFLSAPYTFYQIWKFISPGLFVQERKYVAPFVITSSLLFLAGILFGYFVVLPPAFAFFMTFSSDVLRPMVSFREYISLMLKFLLAFGIVFEIPVFIFFLAKIGLVNAQMLSRQRRYAILAIFIIAAILTPTPDVITQSLMALPMMLLYEIGIVAARFARRKKEAPPAEDAGGDGGEAQEREAEEERGAPAEGAAGTAGSAAATRREGLADDD